MRERFNQFFEAYFKRGSAYQLSAIRPKTEQSLDCSPSADHFYKYFRSGLAHSFAIEWGGVRHIGEGAPAYLYAAPQGYGACLGIDPHSFIAEFNEAMQQCFKELAGYAANSPEALRFGRRFMEVFN